MMLNEDDKKFETVTEACLWAKGRLEKDIITIIAEFEKFTYHKVTKMKLTKNKQLVLRVELIKEDEKITK